MTKPMCSAEIHAQELRARAHLGAVDRRGEALVLEPLDHRARLQGGDPAGPHQAAGHDEAGDLVAGQERPVEGGLVGHVPAGVVGGDGVRDGLLTALAQPGDDAVRVIVRPLLVIGVVQHAGDAPGVLLGGAGAVAVRGRAHDQLDRPGVAPERVSLGPGAEVGPGGVAIEGHGREYTAARAGLGRFGPRAVQLSRAPATRTAGRPAGRRGPRRRSRRQASAARDNRNRR